MRLEKNEKKSKYVATAKRSSSKKTGPAKKKSVPINLLAALPASSRRISAGISADHVVSNALKEISAIIGPELCFLHIRQDDTLVLKDHCRKTGKAKPLFHELQHLIEYFCDRAMSMRKPVFSKNIHKDPLCTLPGCKHADIRSLAALPLIGREGVIGVLTLVSRKERDFFKQEALLGTLAVQIATALDNALDYEKLQRRLEVLRLQLDECAKTEVMLKKSNRTLKALSRCNETLVRETSEAEILHSICCILVNEGGYKLAWIGYAREDRAKSINVMAQCGYEEGYLEKLPLTWANMDLGRGPTGTAIRTGKASVVRDIQNDLRFSSWRSESMKRGYASSMALPLVIGEQIQGTLNVYAAEPDAFDADEITLLEQLAGDISYGITTLRMREAHQETEAALRESREKYQSLFEHANDAIYLRESENGKIIDCNRKAAEMTGYSVEELKGMFIMDLHPVQERALLREKIQTIYENKEGSVVSGLHEQRKDGSLVDIEVNTNIITLGGKKVNVSIVRDVTDRKLLEDVLRNSIDKLQTIIDNTPAVIYAKDLDGRYILINRRYEELFHISKEAVLGMTDHDIFPAAAADAFQANDRMVLAQGHAAQFDETVPHDDGLHYYISVKFPLSHANGKAYGVCGISTDITERRHAEAALRESEERLRVIFDTAREGIVQVSPTGMIVYANRRLSEMFGIPLDEVIGSSFVDHVHPDQRAESGSSIGALASGEVDSVIVERHLMRRDGSDFWGQISARRLEGPDGKIAAMVGVVADVTEWKDAIDALKQSEERYRALFEESKDVIYISSPEGKFIDINPAGVSLFGYSSKGELLSVDIASQIYVDPSERMRFKRTIEKQGFVTDYEVRLKNKKGEELAIMTITSSAVRDKRGNIVAYRGIMRDMTEQRKLEQQLRQSQKMEAIGQLAGGIAHDFNNILSAIIGYGGLVQRKMAPDDANRQNVEQILAAADRAAKLTHSLLAFSRKQIINPKPVNLNDILKNVEKLLSRIIGEDVELRTQTADRDLIVWADSLQIEQVLMNLSTNARDAMPTGGQLILKTEEIDLHDEFMMQGGILKPGRYALLTVTDTGSGMDEKTHEKIFEPFFTTKEVGKGTGLGLAMVYGIIKQHNGYILSSTQKGKGTTFSIYLPLIGPRAGEPDSMQSDLPMKRGTETILIAEDNETVRKMTSTMLIDQGYTVIEAADGEEAIRRFREQHDRIQLLLLDVVLPKKNGKEVYAEVTRVRPDVKVLFMSGYTADVIHAKGIVDEGLHFIPKPANMRELLQKVREVLDA
jgi:PAS domain S-box-containing protein